MNYSRLPRLSQFRPRRTLLPPQTSRRLFSTARRCPSCSTILPTALPTCPTCSHIEPVSPSTSYFDLLNVPHSPNPFKVDLKQLRSQFLQAQRVCHPDTWSRKGDSQHNIAISQSSEINKAFQTLSSPLLRAQYILSQHDFSTKEDTIDDAEMLMTILETREDLEEATEESDIQQIREENQKRITGVIHMLEEEIGNQNWKSAHRYAIMLKYFTEIENAVKEKSL